MGSGATGSWDDSSRGYGQDEEYADADGYRDYPQDDSYAGHEAYNQGAGYGQPGKHGYGQPGEYGRQTEYGDGGNSYHNGYSGGNSYGEAPGYNQSDDYGYPRGDGYAAGSGYAPGNDYASDRGYGPGSGYAQSGGYTQAGDYSDDDYAQGGGYPLGNGYRASAEYPARGKHPADDPYTTGDRYGQSQGYGGNGQEPNGYRAGGYSQSGAYPTQPGRHAQPGGYPALPSGSSHSGDYPVQGTAPSGRADLPGRYAGSDWYGGQPGAASGSGFADTGTYTMDAGIIDSYGTGPRAAEYGTSRYDQDEHEPNGYQLDGNRTGYQGSASTQLTLRGFPPSPPALPAVPEGLVHTGQQERYDDQYESYPGYDGQYEFDDRRGYGAAAEAPRGYDDYDEPGGFGARGYDPADRPGLPGGYDDYADDGDPYQDRYGGGTAPRPAPAATRRSKAGGGRGKRPLLLAALAVVAVGVLGAAAYVFVLKPKPSASGSSATAGPLPTAGSTSAATASCVKQFGQYCHITQRTDDPAPLTLDELFPPQFLNEADHASFARVAARLDKTCGNAVIGQDLISALQSGKCTQVLRASYVSTNNPIMGTIGVVNLGTTNEAHYAGKVVGANDFVMPLSTSKGIASKLGKGTGVVEAEFKGHYLILIWAEFTSTKAPTTKAQDQQLEQFENDLVSGTANISLSQRMVTGQPATAGAAG